MRLNAKQQWEPAAALATPRSFARAVLYQDAVYVVGGNPGYGNSHGASGTAVVERYQEACGKD
jgi:hypothetical protein